MILSCHGGDGPPNINSDDDLNYSYNDNDYDDNNSSSSSSRSSLRSSNYYNDNSIAVIKDNSINNFYSCGVLINPVIMEKVLLMNLLPLLPEKFEAEFS